MISGIAFFLKHWQPIAVGVGIVVIISAIGLHVMKDNRKDREIATLTANNVTLELAVEDQKGVIEDQTDALAEWKAAVENMQETMQAMADNQVEANEQSRRLNDVLGKHDLEALSLAKPGLIEGVINRASGNVVRMLNDETSGNLQDPS